MRFLHTADWHIGKKLHGYNLLEDQAYILEQLRQLALAKKADAIVIAGDLYDRSVPAEEAVALFNRQLQRLNLEDQLPILAISGNHDSATRLATGAPWFVRERFHLHTRLADAFTPVSFADTDFYLLPYFEPIDARVYFADDSLKTIKEAMKRVIAAITASFDPAKKHVLVSHFFVAGSLRTDSETKIEVGGLDGLPAELLAAFDYTALGHLHGKDALQLANARYSGSPLKYSLSELEQEKGVWLVDTTPKLHLEFIPLTPLREIRQLTASFNELLTQPKAELKAAFLQIRLEDRALIPNMMNQLRQVYPYILEVTRLNGRETTEKPIDTTLRSLAPKEQVARFFQQTTGEELLDSQQAWLSKGLESVGGDEHAS